MKRDLAFSLEGQEIDAGSAASLSNKLLQMANGAVYADDGSVPKSTIASWMLLRM